MAENINTVNHRWIRETFEHVNLAVDATCGGGNDTVFLAGLADKVLALDIQLEAVRKTQKKDVYKRQAYGSENGRTIPRHVGDAAQ